MLLGIFMSQFCEQKQLIVQDITILKGLLLQKSVKLEYEKDKVDNIRHFNTKKNVYQDKHTNRN